MKTIKYIFIAAVAFLSLPLFAEDDVSQKTDAKDNAAKVGKKPKGGFLADMDPATRIQIIKQYDANGDGRLDKEERKAAMEAVKSKSADLKEMKEKHAREVIAKYDADGDGKLDEKEVSSFLDAQRKMMDKNRDRKMKRRGNFAMPKEILAKYDADGDGKLNETERKAMHKDMTAKREAMLKKYDADGDGKLSDSERAALIQDPEVQTMMKRMMGDRLQGRGGNNPPPPPAE